jgi:hypothetical protein
MLSLVATNIHANDVAKCAVTFNFLARTMEHSDGTSKESSELRETSIILGNALRKTFSEEKAASMAEAELGKLRRHKDKNALMNELEANYNFCLKLLSR